MFSSCPDAVNASQRREEMIYSYNVKVFTKEALTQYVLDVALLRGMDNPLGTEVVGELPVGVDRTLEKQGEVYLRVDLITRFSNIPKDLKLCEVPIFKQVLAWRAEQKMILVMPTRIVTAYMSNHLDLTLQDWLDNLPARSIHHVVHGLLDRMFIDCDVETHRPMIVSGFAEWILNHSRVVNHGQISSIVREFAQASAITAALEAAKFKLSQALLACDQGEYVNIIPEILSRFTETEERLARLERRKGLSEGFVMPGSIPDAGDCQ